MGKPEEPTGVEIYAEYTRRMKAFSRHQTNHTREAVEFYLQTLPSASGMGVNIPEGLFRELAGCWLQHHPKEKAPPK